MTVIRNIELQTLDYLTTKFRATNNQLLMNYWG